jgi:hypothetical protein
MLQERITRAKDLLKTALHIAIATVNEDGSPHNSPVFYACSPDLQHIYWGTHPQSQHSKNIARTGQVFAVLYDAITAGGLYLRADDAHILEGDELKTGLAVINKARRRHKKEGDLPLENYVGEAPQRLYGATIQQLWVNLNERDSATGYIMRDYRQEITPQDLLH